MLSFLHFADSLLLPVYKFKIFIICLRDQVWSCLIWFSDLLWRFPNLYVKIFQEWWCLCSRSTRQYITHCSSNTGYQRMVTNMGRKYSEIDSGKCKLIYPRENWCLVMARSCLPNHASEGHVGDGIYLIRQHFAILFGKEKQSAGSMNFPLSLLFWFGNTLSVTSPSWQMHGDFNLKWSSQLSVIFFCQSLHLYFWSDYFPSLCNRGKNNAEILHGFSSKLSLFVVLSSWLFKVSLAWRTSGSTGTESKIR